MRLPVKTISIRTECADLGEVLIIRFQMPEEQKKPERKEAMDWEMRSTGKDETN